MNFQKFFNLFFWLLMIAIAIRGMVRKWSLAMRQLKEKSTHVSYVDHICDKRFDGMCVECQLKAGKAFINGLKLMKGDLQCL